MNILLGTHIFYFVNESQHSNKGATTVTSMLHHLFMYHGLGETDVKLHIYYIQGQSIIYFSQQFTLENISKQTLIRFTHYGANSYFIIHVLVNAYSYLVYIYIRIEAIDKKFLLHNVFVIFIITHRFCVC